jgi:hypothetical protein
MGLRPTSSRRLAISTFGNTKARLLLAVNGEVAGEGVFDDAFVAG